MCTAMQQAMHSQSVLDGKLGPVSKDLDLLLDAGKHPAHLSSNMPNQAPRVLGVMHLYVTCMKLLPRECNLSVVAGKTA